MSDRGRDTTRRAYRPAIETLETLRLLDAAAHVLAEIAPDRIAPPAPAHGPTGFEASWDAVLGQTRLADLLAVDDGEARSVDIGRGLGQLDRYLSRSWYRAGIAPQQHADCTQAVYVTLLQTLGRARFDGLLAEIGQAGIRDVLSRETADGPDFFRAIDAIKKRAQRERTFQPLDQVDVAAGPGTSPGDDWHATIREAISQTLNPREAELIDSTMRGETPMEIASRWGVAPKTVSNEKTRAFQKLREVLAGDLDD